MGIALSQSGIVGDCRPAPKANRTKPNQVVLRIYNTGTY